MLIYNARRLLLHRRRVLLGMIVRTSNFVWTGASFYPACFMVTHSSLPSAQSWTVLTSVEFSTNIPPLPEQQTCQYSIARQGGVTRDLKPLGNQLICIDNKEDATSCNSCCWCCCICHCRPCRCWCCNKLSLFTGQSGYRVSHQK